MIAEILGAVAAALAILGVIAGLIKWPVRDWKNRKSKRPVEPLASEAGSTGSGGDATSATDVPGVVLQHSPGTHVTVVTAPSPTPQPDQNVQSMSIGTDLWEGRPASLAEHFVGRQADLDRVAEAMSRSSAVVVSGGGGTGKTRMAAEYTYLSGRGGFWTSAGGTAAQTLAALAPRLRIDTKGLNDEEIAAEVGEAVAALPPTLVWVIDNLPEFGQVNGLQASAAKLTLLITTRNSRRNLLPPTAEFLALTLLEPEAAVDLLRSQGATETDEKVLNEIADIVGYLPMALEMLAVRLGGDLVDAGAVLAELEEAPNPLLVGAFEDAAGEELGKAEGVYSAITGTLKSLLPETRKAIAPFGYLADEPVPLALAVALTGLDTNGLGQLLAECGRQSILTESRAQVVVHALTAAAIATTNEPDALDLAISLAISRLSAINTDEPMAMRAEISHYESLHTHAGKANPSETWTLVFANNLAVGYRGLGRTGEAVELDEQTLEARARVLGREHPYTLISRGNLALGYQDLGRAEEAVELDEETLEARVRVLGPEHMDTLASRNNLAIGYQMLGRMKEAMKLNEETLEITGRVLGAEHPGTLRVRNGLAIVYQALGRTEEAVTLDKESLEASVRVLGPEHPDTLTSRNNLAIGYRMLGRAEEAVELDEETLEARVRVLGPEHPDTLTSWRNLIRSYRRAGRDADADVLAADERFPADG